MNIAVVGCGAISDIYLTNMINQFPNLNVVACCATSLQNSDRKAEKYHIQSRTLEQVLEDPEIQMIVNLTPPLAHGEIIRKAIEAGKHVFTEKVLATNFAEAKYLADLAEQKGVYLGSAPDTFLGNGIQTARKALDEGRIGQVTSCHISLNRRMEHFYEFLDFTRLPGGGIGYDMGPYYLTNILSMLGPVRTVCGKIATSRPNRVNHREGSPNFGKEYTVENENIFTAILEFDSGVLGTVHLNGDSVFPEQPYCAIYGTEGILYFPNADHYGGEVRILRGMPWESGVVEENVLAECGMFGENSRGLAVAEMAQAIEEHRPNRASKEMAVHVVEILDGVVTSAREARTVCMTTTFSQPASMLRWEPWMGEVRG